MATRIITRRLARTLAHAIAIIIMVVSTSILFAQGTVHAQDMEPLGPAPQAPQCPCKPDEQFTVSTRLVQSDELAVIVLNTTHGYRHATAVLSVLSSATGSSRTVYTATITATLAGGATMTYTIPLERFRPLGWLTPRWQWDSQGCAPVDLSPYVRLMFPVVLVESPVTVRFLLEPNNQP
jgi:hypothetical protein